MSAAVRRIAALQRHLVPSQGLECSPLSMLVTGAEKAEAGVALIVGAGSGLSTSCAKLFSKEGFRVAVAARSAGKPELQELAKSFAVHVYECDAAEPTSVERLFSAVSHDLGGFPDLVVYNAGAADRGPIASLDAEKVKQSLLICAFGGFNVAQQAARGMAARGSGSLLFTGASASYKGYANSSSFAMGKFGLHGLAQSLARELGPVGIHVAHFPIDGGIGKVDANGEKTSHWARYQATTTDMSKASGSQSVPQRLGTNGDVIDVQDTMLHPDSIAQAYLYAHRQHRSAWTFEFQLRPWVEKW